MPVFQSGAKPCSLPPLMFLQSGWKGILQILPSTGVLIMAWFIQALVASNSAWATGQVLEYGLKRSADGRYHVYMRPNTAISGSNASLTGQVTIKVPTGTGTNQFIPNDIKSTISNVTWSLSSRTNAPTENNSVDYISFTFTPTGSTDFNFQPGTELEVFNFINPNTCNGTASLLENTESFAIRPNSVGTNPAQQFTNLGWGTFSTNNYLGNYSAAVNCGINHNPIITSNGGGATAAITAPENEALVTTVTATDEDKDTLIYSLSGGVDQSLFMIHPVTGKLSFVAAPNYAQPLDSNGDNIYQVQVMVDDGMGGNDKQDLTITITKSSLYKVLEYTVRRSTTDGRYHVYMRPTMDPSSGADYSLTGQITLTVPHGTGTNRFTIPAGSLTSHINNVVWAQTSRTDAPTENATVDYLSFTFTPYGTQDFQWKKNVEVEVFSFDNSASCEGFVDVMENDDPFTAFPNSVNTQPSNQFTNLGWGPSTANNYLGNYGDPANCSTNRPPVITSNGGADSADITVYDQQSGVTTVIATDPDSDVLTYSIVGGLDADLFLINPNTGRLSFSTIPVFEDPQDTDKNNEYLVIVRAEDGRGGIDEQNLKIKVVKSTQYKAVEYTIRREADKRYHVYMRPTRDPQAGMNYNLTGQITLTVPTGTGAGQFTVSDLQNHVAGVVWDDNSRVNAPTENKAVDYISFTFSPYGHQSFNWQTGVEIDMFSFVNPNQCTGVVDVMENTDPFAKMPNSANSRPANQFTNLGWGPATANNYLGNYGNPVDCHNNSDPIITSNGGGDAATVHVPEGTNAVTTVTATDPDNDTLTFSISGGTDGASFTIDPATGVLTFITTPDYENPADSNKDNTYEVRVTVADGQGGFDHQVITVIVDDVFENVPPVIISDGGGDEGNISVKEGITLATTVVATDENKGDIITYSISGGDDSAKFTIDSVTGVLTFKAPPSLGGQAPWGDMFVPPADKDMNNIYLVNVRATDNHGAYDEQKLNVKLISGLILELQVRAWLQGPFDATTQMMRDSLRLKGLIPLKQPYTLPPVLYKGEEVASAALLLTEGFDAPVDWVVLELRSSTAPSNVLWRTAALIQRDGDIVDASTGSPRIAVNNAPSGRYYLSIQHRNHLGIITSNSVLLENNVATWYDFGLPTSTVMGGTNARYLNAGKAFLWAGDVNHDNLVSTVGTNNDLTNIKTFVTSYGSNVNNKANYKVSGYNVTDINLDGITSYTGANNDISPLIANMVTFPANSTKVGEYTLIGTLP